MKAKTAGTAFAVSAVSVNSNAKITVLLASASQLLYDYKRLYFFDKET
jgi:hypothetical protein